MHIDRNVSYRLVNSKAKFSPESHIQARDPAIWVWARHKSMNSSLQITKIYWTNCSNMIDIATVFLLSSQNTPAFATNVADRIYSIVVPPTTLAQKSEIKVRRERNISFIIIRHRRVKRLHLSMGDLLRASGSHPITVQYPNTLCALVATESR